MRVTCPNCGEGHPRWECKRPPNESTAKAESRAGGYQDARRLSKENKMTSPKDRDMADHVSRSTQAVRGGVRKLPVDTNPREAISLTATSAGTVVDEDRQPLKPNPEWYNGVDALPGHELPPKALMPWPRPPRFDKKAWMREYMRDHRRGILRRPKPTTKREKDE